MNAMVKERSVPDKQLNKLDVEEHNRVRLILNDALGYIRFRFSPCPVYGEESKTSLSEKKLICLFRNKILYGGSG